MLGSPMALHSECATMGATRCPVRSSSAIANMPNTLVYANMKLALVIASAQRMPERRSSRAWWRCAAPNSSGERKMI